MKALNDLCKLNILDSSSMDDVKYYMAPNVLPNRSSTVITSYEYFGKEEDKFAQGFEKFDYKINQYGFREERDDKEIDAGAFGCSFTFGQALPNYRLWHQVLATTLNKTIYNYGVPGSSAQTICDIFCIVSKHVKMRNALVLLPPYFRFQLTKYYPYNNLTFSACIPGHAGAYNKAAGIDESEFYKITPEEEFIKTFKNSVYQMEHIAKLRGINIGITSWDLKTSEVLNKMKLSYAKRMPDWYTPNEITNDRARDGLHPGIEHHKLFADKFKPFVV